MSRVRDSRARASGRGRRSRRSRNRLGKQDLVGENLEEISPGRHKKQGRGFAHFCKEARARASDCGRLLPEIFRRFGDSVEGEGEKIEGGEDGGQVFPTMPEIMFEVITFRFQDVEALVASRPGEFHPRPLSELCVNLSIHTAPIKPTRPPSLFGMVNGFAVFTSFLLLPVELEIRRLDPSPLLQPHYRPSLLLQDGPSQCSASVLSPHG